MKTKEQIQEGIDTGIAYIKEDINSLNKYVDSKNWPLILDQLKLISASVASIMAAEEILK